MTNRNGMKSCPDTSYTETSRSWTDTGKSWDCEKNSPLAAVPAFPDAVEKGKKAFAKQR
jgi:hypothetical protein